MWKWEQGRDAWRRAVCAWLLGQHLAVPAGWDPDGVPAALKAGQVRAWVAPVGTDPMSETGWSELPVTDVTLQEAPRG